MSSGSRDSNSSMFQLSSILATDEKRDPTPAAKAKEEIQIAHQRLLEETDLRERAKSSGVSVQSIVAVEGTFQISVLACRKITSLNNSSISCRVRTGLSSLDGQSSKAQRSHWSTRALREHGPFSRVWSSKDKADTVLSSPGVYAWAVVEVWTLTLGKKDEKLIGTTKIPLSG
jgi:hypothetical protein